MVLHPVRAFLKRARIIELYEEGAKRNPTRRALTSSSCSCRCRSPILRPSARARVSASSFAAAHTPLRVQTPGARRTPFSLAPLAADAPAAAAVATAFFVFADIASEAEAEAAAVAEEEEEDKFEADACFENVPRVPLFEGAVVVTAAAGPAAGFLFGRFFRLGCSSSVSSPSCPFLKGEGGTEGARGGGGGGADGEGKGCVFHCLDRLGEVSVSAPTSDRPAAVLAAVAVAVRDLRLSMRLRPPR